MNNETEKFDCCKVDGNLKIVESTLSKTVYQCTVCEKRHFEFAVSAGQVYGKM